MTADTVAHPSRANPPPAAHASVLSPANLAALREAMRKGAHGAHPGTTLEWWYLTGHLWSEDKAGNEGDPRNPKAPGDRSVCARLSGMSSVRAPDFGMQLTFFFAGHGKRQGILAHAAHSLLGARVHEHRTLAEPFAPGTMKSPAGGVTPGWLDVRLAHWKIIQLGQSERARWQVTGSVGQTEYQLELEKPPGGLWPHGEQGWQRKVRGQGNFYYSIPFMPARGVRIDTSTGERSEVCGSFWFDHEVHLPALDDVGWQWFALRFPSGEAVMIYRIVDAATGETVLHGERFQLAAAERGAKGAGDSGSPSGSVEALSDIELAPEKDVCLKSGRCYPQKFQISFKRKDSRTKKWIPETLQVESAFPEQEMSERQGTGKTYWEGVATVRRGSESGWAYVELVPMPARASGSQSGQ